MQVLKVRPDLGAIVIKGSVPGKPGAIVQITPAKIVGVNSGPQIQARHAKEAAAKKAAEAKSS